MNTEQRPHRSTNREANERFVHLNITYPGHDFGTKMDRKISHVTAFVRTKDGVEYVSFAECDARDQFSRRVGRNVARRKWFAGKRTVLMTGYEFLSPEKQMPLYDRVFDTWSSLSPPVGVAA
jgi:hypothetical protein